MFDISLIKLSLNLNLVNVSIENSSLHFGQTAKTKTKDCYNGALSEFEMEAAYEGRDYSSFNISGYKLPYTILSTFFHNSYFPFSTYKKIKCLYDNHDLYIKRPEDHPLADSSLQAALKSAYQHRRWDNLDQWGERILPASNRSLLRISGFENENSTILYSETDYDTQAVTNLVMDMKVNGRSLRRKTLQNGDLPSLSSRFLANNLGVSMLFLSQDKQPIFPLRDQEGVSIFPNEWGCTVSFAADFPDKSLTGPVSLPRLLKTAINNQLKNEFNEVNPELLHIIPLALCREWFRGGKPQLFMAVESNYNIDEVRKRYSDSEHSKEIKQKGLFKKTKIIWDGKDATHNISIEALANLLLYSFYKQSR